MKDQEFMALMGDLEKHLSEQKVFVKNHARLADIKRATEIAREIFRDMQVSVEDDPLQMGALVLCINGFDIVIRGKTEIALFSELIARADNFEIYPTSEGGIKFAVLFNNALVRVPTQH